MITDLLATRSTSSFPLSVGTGLALESLFEPTQERIDPDRAIPQKVDISQYDQFWVNIFTLARNLLQAIPAEYVMNVSSRPMLDSLIMEIDVIQSLLNSYSNKTELKLYACSYDKALNIRNPYVSPRKDNTDKQKHNRNTLNEAVKLLINHFKQENIITKFDSEIQPDKRVKSLMLTSQIWDLLSHKNFYSLDLIESHTGIIKNKYEFYTKYYNGKDLEMIPFNKLFIYVFGDKDMFAPMNIKVRKEIIQLGIDNRWTQFTTKDKLKNDINKIKDFYLRDVLLSLA